MASDREEDQRNDEQIKYEKTSGTLEPPNKTYLTESDGEDCAW